MLDSRTWTGVRANDLGASHDCNVNGSRVSYSGDDCIRAAAVGQQLTAKDCVLESPSFRVNICQFIDWIYLIVNGIYERSTSVEKLM